MEKAKQVEIENDYKNQVQIIEEELTLIGEYEAQIKQGRLKSNFRRLLNFILSLLFYSLALISVVFYFIYIPEIIAFLKINLHPDHFNFLVGNYDLSVKISTVIEFIFIIIFLLLVISATQISTIRSKNRSIRSLYQIVAILKKNTVDRLETARQKHKHALEFIAENRHRD